MKLHISGPMTGIENFNRLAFNRVAGVLTDMGHAVFNPATDVPPDLPYRLAIARNLAWICEEADGIVMLPDSGKSPGSRAERQAAMTCGLPIWRVRFVPAVRIAADNEAARKLGPTLAPARV